MQQWIVERGTLWALEPHGGLPPLCSARIEVEFMELGVGEIDDLTVVMKLPSPELIQQRLERNRRCFLLRADGRIVTYGWVTHGLEYVGELERTFQLGNDEAYIWDCGTIPAQRGQRCYSALLSQIIYRLQGEGTSRIWIGASRHNKPSIRGFANSGFQPVIDLTYRRFYNLTVLRFREAPTAVSHLVTAAYRILLNDHERCFGRLALGYRRQ